eukprot:11732784-Ditylum_brightwellii.AAC.1
MKGKDIAASSMSVKAPRNFPCTSLRSYCIHHQKEYFARFQSNFPVSFISITKQYPNDFLFHPESLILPQLHSGDIPTH